jgi:anion-transporting  ArsA/GET3 family ATPase
VAAAAAVAAARRGRRVLIVEIGEHERIPGIFASPNAGYGGRNVYTGKTRGSPPIWSVCLTARDALHEFGLLTLKLQVLSDAVFDNRVVRYFTAAAPGLDELILMGKIEYLHRQGRLSPRGPSFDLIVLDAPATGHGLALLAVPKVAMRLTLAGPLHGHAERAWKLLSDEERTALTIVTLPEEMSVTESLELHAAAEDLQMPRGAVVVNGMYPDLFRGEADRLRRILDGAPPPSPTAAQEDAIARAALERAVAFTVRRSAQEAMVERLAEVLPQKRAVLPFLFLPKIGPDEVETLADGLEGL